MVGYSCCPANAGESYKPLIIPAPYTHLQVCVQRHLGGGERVEEVGHQPFQEAVSQQLTEP